MGLSLMSVYLVLVLGAHRTRHSLATVKLVHKILMVSNFKQKIPCEDFYSWL